MKNILIINNNSPEAKHAAIFALRIARQMHANIIIANNYIKANERFEKALIGVKSGIAKNHSENLKYHLLLQDKQSVAFIPQISEIDINGMNADELAQIINKIQLLMMVKGGSCGLTSDSLENKLNVHSVLNKVLCPLLLVPANWQIKNIERIVYIADLRYCRIQIVRYLADLAKSAEASLSIAHISAKGLPDLIEPYAIQVFNEEVSNNVKYDRLFFNNIKEKDLKKAVDVLINGMQNDLLVMVNHRFHFEEILGRYITENLPGHISAPLLIFPY